MSREFHFGSIDSRQLHLYVFWPLTMSSWQDGGFCFSFWRALNPKRWWRLLWDRNSWGLSIVRHTEVNHRCYCPVGSLIDGHIWVFGSGITFWYSSFAGPIPCPCDDVLREIEEANDD